jgi:hypothetical protein
MHDKENELFDDRYNKLLGLMDDLELKYWHLHQLIFGHVKSVTPAMWMAARDAFSADFLDMFSNLKLRYLQARALLEHECDSCEQKGKWTYYSDKSSTGTKWMYFDDEQSCILHASRNVESYPIVVYHWQIGDSQALIAPLEQSSEQDESDDLKVSWTVSDDARWLCI